MIQAQTQPRALTTPFLDFWLLGGLSWLCLAAFVFVNEAYKIDLTDQVYTFFFYAAFVVNYPHFAYSYQLFYADFRPRLSAPETPLREKIRLAITGWFVPALMAGYLIGCYFSRDTIVLGYGVHAMLFFVGWHYTKQGYGVLITLSVYKNVFYSLWQKRALYVHAYAVWMYSWVRMNSRVGKSEYYDVYFYTLGFSDNVFAFFKWIAVITGLFAAAAVLKAWKIDRRGISFNALVGYCSAIYLWIAVFSMHVGFTMFMFAIPLFHSLQYLAFVYKFKKNETAEAGDKKLRRRIDFALIGFVLGGLLMDIGPRHIDKMSSINVSYFTKNFFLLSCLLFINIHHYFIDNAFWRRENEKVQKYLFRG